MSIVKKVSGGIKSFGWGTGLIYVAARALQAATFGHSRIIKYNFVAQPVPDRVLAPGASALSTTVYQVAPDDLIVQQFPRPRHIIAQRFREGAICFVAVKRDALVGFIWIKQDQYMEDEVRCLYVLEPRGVAVWDFDVWVAPEFRLTRAFARLWDAANTFLRERGYRWCISRISAFNPASLASHRRLGIEHLHSAVFCLLGPAQLAFLSCAPYLHVGIRQQHCPVLRLRAPCSIERRDIGARTEPARR